MKELFGGLFDFDNDREKDAFERTMEFGFLEELESESNKSWDTYDYDDDDMEF